MIYTQAHLDQIDQAIIDYRLKGVKSIQFGDQVLTFDTIEELLRLRSTIASSLTTARPYRVAAVDKGV